MPTAYMRFSRTKKFDYILWYLLIYWLVRIATRVLFATIWDYTTIWRIGLRTLDILTTVLALTVIFLAILGRRKARKVPPSTTP